MNAQLKMSSNHLARPMVAIIEGLQGSEICYLEKQVSLLLG